MNFTQERVLLSFKLNLLPKIKKLKDLKMGRDITKQLKVRTLACVASVPFRQKEVRNDFPQTGRAEVGARD